jgi:hypothetical protein
MADLTDIREMKKVLEIDPNNPNEDVNLSFWIGYATDIIEEFLGRKLFYKQRTEFYNGSGTQKLTLRSRPVYVGQPNSLFQLVPAPAVPVVFEDETAFYGSAPGAFTGSGAQLTYGTDFCLKLDDGDGISSRSGILVKINDFWQRPQARVDGLLSPFLAESFGNIKVTYFGGYTVDTLPGRFRLAADFLIAKIRYMFPLGIELVSESYEERSIASMAPDPRRNYLLSLVKPLIFGDRNFHF